MICQGVYSQETNLIASILIKKSDLSFVTADIYDQSYKQNNAYIERFQAYFHVFYSISNYPKYYSAIFANQKRTIFLYGYFTKQLDCQFYPTNALSNSKFGYIHRVDPEKECLGLTLGGSGY